MICYSSASETFDATFPTNVVVTSEGMCTYIPPGNYTPLSSEVYIEVHIEVYIEDTGIS